MKRVVVLGVVGPEVMAETPSGLVIPEKLAQEIEKKALKDFVETLAAKSFDLNPADQELAN